ncbi:hypothetical protein TNCV_1968381 [Trichonephila clavipes]|nr:hypothetical protein TNCV_1968381 [Trichonephila clavipes]
MPEQMLRSGGQSEARLQCLSTQASLVFIYRPTAYLIHGPLETTALNNRRAASPLVRLVKGVSVASEPRIINTAVLSWMSLGIWLVKRASIPYHSKVIVPVEVAVLDEERAT